MLSNREYYAHSLVGAAVLNGWPKPPKKEEAPIGVNFGPASYQWWHDADWFIEWERLAYGS